MFVSVTLIEPHSLLSENIFQPFHKIVLYRLKRYESQIERAAAPPVGLRTQENDGEGLTPFLVTAIVVNLSMAWTTS